MSNKFIDKNKKDEERSEKTQELVRNSKELLADIDRLSDSSRRSLEHELEKRGLTKDELIGLYDRLPQEVIDFLDHELILVLKQEESLSAHSSDIEVLESFLKDKQFIQPYCPIDIAVSYEANEDNMNKLASNRRSSRTRRWI